MPFAFLIIGAVLITSGVRNTYSDLFKLVKGDFSGPNNFTYWMVAILILGSLGYVDELKGFSRAFLALVLVVLILSNRGFFSKFNQQIFSSSNSGA